MSDSVYHPRYCLEPHANCWSILLRRCPGDDYIGGSAMFTDGVSDPIKIFLSIPHWLTDNFHYCVAVYSYFPCWKCSSSYYPTHCIHLHLRHLPSRRSYPQCCHKCQQGYDSRFNSNFYYCWVVLCTAYHEHCRGCPK